MTKRHIWVFAAALLTLSAFGVRADVRGGSDARGGGGGRSAGGGGGGFRASFAARRPVTINLGRPSSGFGGNFPSRQAAQPARSGQAGGGYGNNVAAGQGAAQRSPTSQPSWGHVSWSASGAARPAGASYASRLPAGTFRPASGTRMALAQHHHPYTPGYVRHKLRKLGVTTEPSLITDRSQMLHTDPAHSTITYPTQGPQGAALSGHAFDPRVAADAGGMKAQMARVNSGAWRTSVENYNSIETQTGRYYWHRGSGFDYCHYRDSSGYQWYGWYLGGGFFWTRDFDGRWWWYDQAEARWNFYNNGFWWWQDPDHVGDLYCYDDGDYVPCNSAQDPIVVSQPESADFTVFNSPDGTRTVKLVAGGEDAFLYDDTQPPSFDPIYLASGVQSVQFSDPSNGRPMEIMLRLDDGSFDLFDAQGRPYGPGTYDQDAAGYSGQQPGPDGGGGTAIPYNGQ